MTRRPYRSTAVLPRWAVAAGGALVVGGTLAACGEAVGDPIVGDDPRGGDTGDPSACVEEGYLCGYRRTCCEPLACVNVGDPESVCVDPDLLCGTLGSYCIGVLPCCEGLTCVPLPTAGGMCML